MKIRRTDKQRQTEEHNAFYVHRNKFLFNKTNRRTNFPNIYLSRNSTYFGQFLCPSSGVFHLTFGTGICHAGLMTAFMHDQDGTAVPSWSCVKAVIKPAWHIPVPNVQWKTPDDGQRNCPKHVEFLDKNKFGKLVRLLVLLKRNMTQLIVPFRDFANAPKEGMDREKFNFTL